MKTKEQQEEVAKSGGKIIELNEEVVKEHLTGMVLASVEETLNALLDAEADRLCRVQRYERSEQRRELGGQSSYWRHYDTPPRCTKRNSKGSRRLCKIKDVATSFVSRFEPIIFPELQRDKRG